MSAVKVEMQLEKFIQLWQGDFTLKKYINKFSELSKFRRSKIDTPMKKAMKFVKGINSTTPNSPFCNTFPLLNCHGYNRYEFLTVIFIISGSNSYNH